MTRYPVEPEKRRLLEGTRCRTDGLALALRRLTGGIRGRRFHHVRRDLASVVVVLAIALAAAPKAWGGTTVEGGFTYAFKNHELAPGQTKTFRSKCPSSTKVLGGGSLSNSSGGELYQSGTYPYDGSDRNSSPDDGWAVKLTSFDRTVTGLVYAICAPVATSYEVRRKAVPGEGLGQWGVECDGSRDIVHGGYKGPAGTLPRSSYPFDAGGAGDGWVLQIWSETAERKKIKGYAVCSNALDVSYASVQRTESVDGSTGETPPCPVNAPNIVGGGFVNSESQLGNFRVVDDTPFIAGATNFWSLDVEIEGAPVLIQLWSDCAPDL
jgi:hypothetical protein